MFNKIWLGANGNYATGNTSGLVSGWNVLEFSVAEMTESGTVTWAGIDRIDFTIDAEALSSPICWIESISYDGYTRPKVVVSIDDGFVSSRDVSLPIIESAGLKAQLYISRQYSDPLVRADDGTYLMADDINTILSSGHAIGVHGNDWVSEAITANVITEIEAEIAWFTSEGWTAYTDICAYPQGRHDPFIYDAVNTKAFKMARTQRGGQVGGAPDYSSMFSPDGNNWLRIGGCYTPPDGEAASVITGLIDDLIVNGGFLHLIFHNVNALSGYRTADFQTVIDKLVTEKVAGNLDVVTDIDLRDTVV